MKEIPVWQEGKAHFVKIGNYFEEYTAYQIMRECLEVIYDEKFGENSLLILAAEDTHDFDHNALAVMIRVNEIAKGMKCRVGIIPSERIKKVLRLTGLEQHFLIFANQDEVVNFLQ